MKKTIFISHASPEDNDFARWLSLQLIGLGYNVWCDVIKLRGGEDWWISIENEIRNNTIKFLVILSSHSNQKDGVLKELAVASKVKKSDGDAKFIIPLHIDNSLSYDDINIELNRLNSINFKKSWADGLSTLLEQFDEENIPKDRLNYDEVSSIWNTVYLQNKKVVEEKEIYFSNWFPIVELPKILRFHKFKRYIARDFNVNTLPFPVAVYGQYIATFGWFDDFISQLPETINYSPSDSINIPTDEIFSDNYTIQSIQQNDAKRIVIQLLNKGFEKSIKSKPVKCYEMSNSNSYWVAKDVLEKDKYNRVLLVGKQKDKHWHFGISATSKMFPEKCFVVSSHIWFTSNGVDLIESDSKQHAARRKQGKNWWNNDWRNKLIAFMQFLSEEDGNFHVKLGSQEIAKVSVEPIMFESPVKYTDPNTENLPDEVQGYDEFEENEELIPESHEQTN